MLKVLLRVLKVLLRVFEGCCKVFGKIKWRYEISQTPPFTKWPNNFVYMLFAQEYVLGSTGSVDE